MFWILVRNLSFCFLILLPFLSQPSYASSSEISRGRKVKIALVESQGYNEEVWLAFAQALSSIKNIETTIGLVARGNNVTEIVNHFDWSEKKPQILATQDVTNEFLIHWKADIYVSVTCDQELLSNNKTLSSLLKNSHLSLFCVTHRADHYKAGGEAFLHLLPWIKAQRVQMITLSEHVSSSLATQLGLFESLVPITAFPPIFQIDSEILGREDQEILQFSDITRKMVLQGVINHDKRDYLTIINDMKEEGLKSQRKIEGGGDLLILGRGELIDTGDSKKISQLSNLPYPEYFKAMAQSDVLLIGNRKKDIFFNEVSSSLAAALISGTPIVADREVLDAYTYLSPDVLIEPRKGQTHVQAAFDYFALPPLLHTRKRTAIATLRKSIILQNKYRLSRWINSSVSL